MKRIFNEIKQKIIYKYRIQIKRKDYSTKKVLNYTASSSKIYENSKILIKVKNTQ